MFKKLNFILFLISYVHSFSFTIDFENDTFLKDEQPFRIISGSLHYFRVPHFYWQDRLQKYKKAGLNTVETYIEWSFHETKKNQFDFTDNKDIINFIKLAKRNHLFVILRLGPYICAERDNGGLPYWLKNLHPDIRLRSSDPRFLKHVEDWFSHLLPKLKPFLYENGGPILMLQIENEYGSYFECDHQYMIELKNYVQKIIGTKTILMTTDGPRNENLKCGTLDGVYKAIDFGTKANITWSFEQQRKFQPKGPLFNNEFYPGWLDFWGEKRERISSQLFCKILDKVLSWNASVNIYMFHGGTSFGFYSGANTDDNYNYKPIITSYDYDAPINEFGNLTQKYFDIRNVLKKYSEVEEITKSDFVELTKFNVTLKPLAKNFTNILKKSSICVKNEYPLTFEELDVEFGFVLYETYIDIQPTTPVLLLIDSYADRAYVYINDNFVGIMSRSENIKELSLIVKKNSKLSIIVENQGRVNFGNKMGDTKGIKSNIYLSHHKLVNWTHCFSKNWKSILDEINNINYAEESSNNYQFQFFKGTFVLKDELKDTFIDFSNWSKGIVFLNNYNLGKYWTKAGPQITLYAPSNYFKPTPFLNTLILLEQEEHDCNKNCTIKFVDYNELDGPVPN